MSEERDYGMFDDDAEDLAPEETVDEPEKKKKQKKNKKKIDREGSKKHKKGKGIRRPFVKIVIGGIVLFVAAGLFLGKAGPKNQPAPSAPQDDYYLTVNFTDVENMDLDDLFIYSEGGNHSLVYMIDGTNDAVSICDNYVIEDAKTPDAGCSLTPLEGTELFESIINGCNVETINKVDVVSFAGVKYYMSVDRNDLGGMLQDADCAEVVSEYTADDGTVYDNLSDFLNAIANSNNLGKSK